MACRVLVVEDNYLVADVLIHMLTDAGCVVVGPVGQLSAARQIAEGDDFDIALLDINLAGEMVYPVADRLADRGVPFAFLTGYTDLGPRYRLAPRLHKPFRLAAFLTLLERLRAAEGS